MAELLVALAVEKLRMQRALRLHAPGQIYCRRRRCRRSRSRRRRRHCRQPARLLRDHSPRMNLGKTQGTFWPCPRLHAETSAEAFWEMMSTDPRPRILEGGMAADFVREFGHTRADGTADFAGLPAISAAGTRYQLSNPGRRVDGIFMELPRRFPLPAPLRQVDLCPMVSIGLNGTGQRDLARHYHSVTAMLLLQGRKIWALRAPGDAECARATGSCTDPFDVCAFYARPGAPPPACVQEAGDTIVVPDGWYHGTCNNASWTVGWGGQGRRLPLTPPACFHCRPARLYASSAEPLVAAADAQNLIGALASVSRRVVAASVAGGGGCPSWRAAGSHSLETLGGSGQAVLMSVRSLMLKCVHAPASRPTQPAHRATTSTHPLARPPPRRPPAPAASSTCRWRKHSRCRISSAPSATCTSSTWASMATPTASTAPAADGTVRIRPPRPRCARRGTFTSTCHCARRRRHGSSSGIARVARRRRARFHCAMPPRGWVPHSRGSLSMVVGPTGGESTWPWLAECSECQATSQPRGREKVKVSHGPRRGRGDCRIGPLLSTGCSHQNMHSKERTPSTNYLPTSKACTR